MSGRQTQGLFTFLRVTIMLYNFGLSRPETTRQIGALRSEDQTFPLYFHQPVWRRLLAQLARSMKRHLAGAWPTLFPAFFSEPAQGPAPARAPEGRHLGPSKELPQRSAPVRHRAIPLLPESVSIQEALQRD